MLNTFEKLKNGIFNNMDGLIALSITDIESGMSYFGDSNDSNFDIEIAAPFNLQVLKAKMEAAKALNIKDQINDIVINFDSQAHIIDVALDNSYFIYIAIDTNKMTFEECKAILKEQKNNFLELAA